MKLIVSSQKKRDLQECALDWGSVMSEPGQVPFDLFLPATERQLHGFADKLTTVAKRFSSPFAQTHSVEFEAKVSYGRGEGGHLYYAYEDTDDMQEFEFSYGRVLPIDKRWSAEAAKAMLGSNYAGYNQNYPGNDVKNDDEFDGDTHVYDYEDEKDDGEDDELGFIEGFVEHETKLEIVRTKRCIDAKKSVLVNVLDEDSRTVNCEVVHFRDADVPLDYARQQDVERLIRYGETMIDFTDNENLLNLLTAADLIIAMHALIASGVVPKHTRAFKGAPEYATVEIYLPKVYV